MPLYIADTSIVVHDDDSLDGTPYQIETFEATDQQEAIAKAHATCRERAEGEWGCTPDATLVERLREVDHVFSEDELEVWIDTSPKAWGSDEVMDKKTI